MLILKIILQLYQLIFIYKTKFMAYIHVCMLNICIQLGDIMCDEKYLVTDIVDINTKKKKIYINYDLAFALYNAELRKYNIIKNEYIDERSYELIHTEVLIKRAKTRAMNLLKNSDFTEFTLTKKLKDNYYPETVINKAIEFVKQYNYIDDSRYAGNYVAFNANKKSRLQIINFLSAKGISKDIIFKACDEYYEDNDNTEKELIIKLISKKKTDLLHMTWEERNKLFNYLTRKGFKIDSINNVISGIVNK